MRFSPLQCVNKNVFVFIYANAQVLYICDVESEIAQWYSAGLDDRRFESR